MPPTAGSRLVYRSALAAVGAGALLAAPVAGPDALSAAPRRCGPPIGGAGSTITVPVTSQGVTYEVPVHVPTGYDGARRIPLVFNLHGSFGSGAMEEQTTGTDAQADEHTFAVAYPNGSTYEGLPGTPAGGYLWHIPGTAYFGGATAPPGTRDDVEFIADTIDTVSARLCIDRRMVYATGLSAGGRMASLLACALSERIAAIAPVAGIRAGNPDSDDPTQPDPSTCQPARSVPVLAFHGRTDPVNPYDGGGQSYWRYSVPAALTRWAEINRCQPEPRTEPITSTIDHVVYEGCAGSADVELYRSSVGGHSWPGQATTIGFGLVDMSISANELMWQFFRDHKL